MKTYYKVIIDETGATNLKEQDFYMFNQEVEYFKTLEEAKQFLIDRYNIKDFKKLTACYVDTDNGSKQVGYIRSYWNKDISHNSKSWWQQDWITVKEITENEIIF